MTDGSLALNPLGRRTLDVLLGAYPDWSAYATESEEGGDLELVVPAPERSRAKCLVVQTLRGEDVWVRYAPPYMVYGIDSDAELLKIVGALLSDAASFLVITNGDEWVETTLLSRGQEPVLEKGQVANVVSWSGVHDRIVTNA